MWRDREESSSTAGMRWVQYIWGYVIKSWWILVSICFIIFFSSTVFPETPDHCSSFLSSFTQRSFKMPISIDKSLFKTIQWLLTDLINITNKKNKLSLWGAEGDGPSYALTLILCSFPLRLCTSVTHTDWYSLSSLDMMSCLLPNGTVYALPPLGIFPPTCHLIWIICSHFLGEYLPDHQL